MIAWIWGFLMDHIIGLIAITVAVLIIVLLVYGIWEKG